MTASMALALTLAAANVQAIPSFARKYGTSCQTLGSRINDVKIIPGIAALVLPNLKLTLTGQIEWADGAPDGEWGAWGGSASPMMGSVTELESIQLGLAFAF